MSYGVGQILEGHEVDMVKSSILLLMRYCMSIHVYVYICMYISISIDRCIMYVVRIDASMIDSRSINRLIARLIDQ